MGRRVGLGREGRKGKGRITGKEKKECEEGREDRRAGRKGRRDIREKRKRAGEGKVKKGREGWGEKDGNWKGKKTRILRWLEGRENRQTK